MECLVLYEGWQMECCGIPFSNSSMIKWLVIDGSNIKLPIQTSKIDYYYENHDSNYEKISILEGTVKYIKALYQNYKQSADNLELLVPQDAILVDIDNSSDIAEMIEDKKFDSYIVCVENYTIRAVKQSEVTFR